jgi:hypothetical protein
VDLGPVSVAGARRFLPSPTSFSPQTHHIQLRAAVVLALMADGAVVPGLVYAARKQIASPDRLSERSGRTHLRSFASRRKVRRSRGPLEIGETSLDAAVVSTEAGYTYRIGQTLMRFAGERRRGERGEEDEKRLKAKSLVVCT